MNILEFTLQELSQKLQKKELSATEIVNAYINSSIKARELNLYITETFDEALNQAKLADERWQKGKQLSDFDGIPLGIKDIFLVKNVLATNASKILSNFVAPFESTVTQKLLDKGYIFLGKLNMDEFAMGSTNMNSHFGATINPWGYDENPRVPGGSSGASAAAVAARAAVATLGTDTGGSVRQPASFCGVVGMKPTYGTCSRYGIISFASSLDQAGPVTRNVEDNAILLQAMAGYDEKDSTMIKIKSIDYSAKIGQSIKGKKVGIPKEYMSDNLSVEIKDYWVATQKMLEDAGAEIVEISLPHSQSALAVYYIIAPTEASSNFARYDGIRYGKRSDDAKNLEEVYMKSRTQGWGLEVKRRVLLGTYNLLSENISHYLQATKVRRLVTNDFVEAFKKVDVILTPTTTGEAFAMNNIPKDPITMYFNDIFTVPVNLAGNPAISLPVGLAKSQIPIGMQLIGNHYCEDELYQVAAAVEKQVNFKQTASFVKNNNL